MLNLPFFEKVSIIEIYQIEYEMENKQVRLVLVRIGMYKQLSTHKH